jgi:hypothetical protein
MIKIMKYYNKDMKSTKYFILLLAGIALTLTSCSDFLDKTPDERTEIDNETKVKELLASAYPGANYEWLAELSSDNFIDNQAPHLPTSTQDKQILAHYNYGSYARFDDQLYNFDPATQATYNDYDSPGMIWGDYYSSIAVANQALKSIDEIAAKNGATTTTLKVARAEALLIRAYSHFMLVNIFGQPYRDAEKSKSEVGVPYVTEVEDVVSKNYKRDNVADVYAKIQTDLEAGLADISDVNYKYPKYHFNVNAANAFAARFYLYTRQWEKVIKYADKVIGSDSATTKSMTMDYSVFANCASASDYANAWQKPALNNNLMLITTGSLLSRRIFGYRYSLAGPNARAVMMVHSSPLWSGYILPAIAIVGGMAFSSSSGDYGYYNCKMGEQFQYTDKIAGIGYPKVVVRAFTGSELLLERAEAKIMLARYDDAANDLMAYWNNSINSFSEKDYKAYVTAGYINYLKKPILLKYYSNSANSNCFDNWDFTSTNISSSYVIPKEAVPYMNCLNDFRRFETMFEGLRFFDLKRWGIEYDHVIGVNSTKNTLTGTDTRRAIEVPWEALSAGLESSRPQVSAPAQVKASINLQKLIAK